MSRALPLVIAIAAGLAAPAGARAFLFAETFDQPVQVGGGGGRHFTGSFADGYTCAVCHRGGAEPSVALSGWADGEYVPGRGYELLFEWEADAIGAVVEITDASGATAGTVSAIPDGELAVEDLCRDGTTAARAFDVEGRTVVHVGSCGTRRLRVRWTAPSDGRAVWLNAIVVGANRSGTPEGDGVREIVSAIAGPGAPRPEAVVVDGGGCSIGAGSGTSTCSGTRTCSGTWAVGIAALLLVLRRRGWLAAALLVVWPAPAFAVPGPDSTAVLANAMDPESVELARVYAVARSIPRRQVCLVDAPRATDISLDEYQAIHGAFEACLTDAGVVDRIEAVVVMRGMPLRVAVDGTETASFTATLGAWRSTADGMPLIGQPAGALVRCGATAMCYGASRPNPWGAGPFYPGWEAVAGRVTWRPLLVTMLHGRTYAEAEMLIANSLAADGGIMPGEYLFMDGADAARGVRDADYASVIAALEERGIATVTREPFNPDLTGRSLNAFFTGTASLGMTIEGNTYLPGSLVDNVTSYGAAPQNFTEGGETQVSIARWIAAGAAGVHGTTEEPLNNCFPSRWLIVDYVDGSTLAESYHRRLPFWYWRNLVLGDAMAAPYAVRPTVEIEGVPTGETVTGAARLRVRAGDPLDRGVDSLALFIDGVEVARSAGEDLEHCFVPTETATAVQILAVAQIRDDGSDAAFHRPKGWTAFEVGTEPGATECAAPIADAGPPSDAGPGADAGTTEPPDRGGDEGCGCTVPERRAPGAPSGLALVWLLALGLRLVRDRQRGEALDVRGGAAGRRRQ